MKITTLVGKIHYLNYIFLVVVSRNSSEETCLGMMSQLNLNKNSYGYRKSKKNVKASRKRNA